MGFDWLWFLSVWQTGPAAQTISRADPGWRREFEETLPDLKEEDIAGSGFAIQNYIVHRDLGGDAALARLRQRLQVRGLKLMLDFVPNHMAPDHPWVEEHPDYFIAGTEELLAQEPHNYVRVKRKEGDLILAHGRDPYFPGWPDTVQIDYSHPAAQEAMIRELEKIAGQCDGVRCDMAMLLLPEVFERTWGRKPAPFWPAAIPRVREQAPDFCFMAEVYWDLEWTLQQQGFDYTYDKRLYDRLREGNARPVREHLHAALDYQAKLARFLENHDEPRAAAVFDPDVHRAAAVITYTIPGLRFFHQGQFEGRKKRISPHLIRAPQEAVDKKLRRSMTAVARRSARSYRAKRGLAAAYMLAGLGRQRILGGIRRPFLARSRRRTDADRRELCTPRQPVLYPPAFSELENRTVQLTDSLSSARYTRDGNELLERGLYLDMDPGPIISLPWRLHYESDYCRTQKSRVSPVRRFPGA